MEYTFPKDKQVVCGWVEFSLPKDKQVVRVRACMPHGASDSLNLVACPHPVKYQLCSVVTHTNKSTHIL